MQRKVGGILMSAFSFFIFGRFKIPLFKLAQIKSALYHCKKKGESGFIFTNQMHSKKLADNFKNKNNYMIIYELKAI
jgi:hypothetical protein